MVIYYLFWDWEAYQNLQNQNYLAGVIANAMNANILSNWIIKKNLDLKL